MQTCVTRMSAIRLGWQMHLILLYGDARAELADLKWHRQLCSGATPSLLEHDVSFRGRSHAIRPISEHNLNCTLICGEQQKRRMYTCT
jgi:hypothetical protein